MSFWFCLLRYSYSSRSHDHVASVMPSITPLRYSSPIQLVPMSLSYLALAFPVFCIEILCLNINQQWW
ncbi:hypothetical protein CC80DRAFT_493080 [Byssothecium circinans]|uniref:Uncharacterized protein n=1 Tax=Byssothecium circinans TaxID=147558 RepID=A0A6A5TV32_9PLEO|nr:hypothetical protein CC80DRAFT_493080 [Byssothecium circinans]